MRFLVSALLAASALATTTPVATRLSYVPQGMAISWSTESELKNPTVTVGLSSSNLSPVGECSSNTYGTQFFHTCVVNNLTPKTTYFYQVLAGDSSSTNSAVRSFTTAHAAGDQSEFNIFVVGDMGMKNSGDVMASMKQLRDTTDFVLHIGDVSYADDWYLRPASDSNTYEKTWVEYQNEMEEVTAFLPYMVEPGNHEATCTEATPFVCPEVQRNFTAFNHRFRMPSAESGGVANMWYSFDFGSVHFVQISTETDFEGAPEGPGTYLHSGPFGNQLAWLQADLESAQKRRSQVPWIIVSGHRPLYSSGGGCKSCISAFEDLFLKYNVDIFFAGHVHWYERLWPLGSGGSVTQHDYNEPAGVVHIVSGAGGNVEGHSRPGHVQPYSALINDVDYGYGRLTVYNSTDIAWDFIAGTGSKIVDSIAIHKSH